MKTALLNLFALGCLALVGCASMPPTASAPDVAAKKFQTEPGKASLYISRKGIGVASEPIPQIVLDGRNAGSLPAGTYQLIKVDPGTHVLLLNISPDDLQTLPPGQFQNKSQLSFTAEPGRNYFFQAGLLWGWGKPQLNLVQTSPAAGQKDIQAARPVPASDR
jgi:hypothetical protein